MSLSIAVLLAVPLVASATEPAEGNRTEDPRLAFGGVGFSVLFWGD